MGFSVLILCQFSSAVFCQEVPKITSFDTKQISTSRQNWSIVQDCDGYLYVANSQGILIYNGFQWQLIRMPNNHKPRTVFLGNNCKVYAGGYEFFGWVDNSNRLAPTYIPIADTLLKGSTQEIWNIFGKKNDLIFQSFSNLYFYDYQDITEISLPTNIMLGSTVNEQFYIPKIEQGLYTLDKEIKQLRVGNELPATAKIAAMVPGVDDQNIILGTQYHGIYVLNKNRLTPLDGKLNEILKNEQINKILRLSSGDYVIGTILNGIYITSDFIEVKFHINKSNGLPNNTVLSLFEDDHQDLWVGLDKGLCLIEVSNKTLYFYDQQGKLGTLFDAVSYNEELYLGTNQGVFIRQEDGYYKLIENSQGQVWSFLEVGEDLLCGHNAGTFLLTDGKFEKISDITGGWDMVQIDENRVLQATYTGIIVLEKIVDKWDVAFRVKEGNVLLEKFVLDDHKMVGYHNNNGIIILEFNADFSEVVKKKTINRIGNLPIPENNQIITTSNDVLLLCKNHNYLLESDSFRLLNNHEIVEFTHSGYGKMIFNGGRERTRTANLHTFSGNNPSLVDSSLIYNFDGGYVIDPLSNKIDNTKDSEITLDYFTVNGENYIDRFKNEPLHLKPHQNDVKIFLRRNTYDDLKEELGFKLENWDSRWFPVPQNGQIDFFNLNNETYSFHIKAESGSIEDPSKILTFEIKPHWYESWVGWILYSIVGVMLFWLLQKRNESQLRRKTAKIKLEQEKELESERIKAKNAELERELIYKSKMLANSAMTLVQKNKILNELKLLIKKNREVEDQKKPRQKLLNIIDRNINSDQDWDIFEQNFAEVHKDFLNTLTEKFPKITSGDMKLAAYIKMNLSSKEIAPLLDISVRSVENKRYRLRKKLGIDHDDNLKEYLVRL